MASEPDKRRLAAIVSIDVAGYSALSERDEAAAINRVAWLRRQASAIADRHSGRIFSTAGDGVMLEFPTATDALAAAIALCESEPDHRCRLGVHVGEVLAVEDGDLLGHGVNIAARLQAEAPLGGILVSQIVRDTAQSALADRLVARGRIRLAKMRATLNVFALAPKDQTARASSAQSPPVLAVLPFDNLSRDRDLRFFSDGVSAEILHSVSRVRGLKVIGSTSSFAFRGREKKKAAAALGATHVLDGSVQRSGERVRITAQLTEADAGVVVWFERYDRELADAFVLQEDIAGEVAAVLELALTEAQRTRGLRLTAALFDAYLRAREHIKSGAPARVAEAVSMLGGLTQEAPGYARGWSAHAMAVVESMRLARSDQIRLAELAYESAQRAIGIDETIGEAYFVLAALESEFGRWPERKALLEGALRGEPNNPLLRFRHGQMLVSVGRVRDGYAQQARAFELDPLDPMLAAFHGHNVWATKSKSEGRTILDKAALRAPDNIFLWYMRYNLAALDGEFAKANALRDEGLPLLPELADSVAFKSSQMMQEVMAAPTPQSFMKLGEDFTAMAAKQPSAALDLAVALSVLGMTKPALKLFEDSLNDVEAWRRGAPDALRPHVGYETALLFIQATMALRMDPAFAHLCARLGLVKYWSDTGEWPDCAADVAAVYDFKTECLRLAS